MALEPTFNLIEEPWIPCVALDGSARELGLLQVLERAREMREVHADSPPKTVALHRLLLAVLQRAWEGESEDERAEEWEAWWTSGLPIERIHKYLQENASAFDLCNPARPFYQTAGLEVEGVAHAEAASIVGLELRQKNNPTLFDHSLESSPPPYTLAQAARALLMAQSYVVGGTGSRNAIVNGRVLATPSNFEQGNLIKGVAVWLAGDSLFETLMLNLVPDPAAPGDRPIWERSPDDQLALSTSYRPRVKPPSGILDRLTWQSRMIRLLFEPLHPHEESGASPLVVRRALVAQGRSSSEEGHPDEEMKAYKRSLKSGLVPVALNSDRAAWRDSHALLSMREGDKRPAAVRWVAQHLPAFKGDDSLLPRDRALRLHVAGLVADKAKIMLWRHDRMPAPIELLADADLVATIESANEDARWLAEEMLERMKRVCRLFLAPGCESSEGRKPHAGDVSKLADQLDPRRAYWPRLEAHFHQFLHALPHDRAGALEAWRDKVQREAARCFNESTRALGTSPRTIQAVAHVSAGFLVQSRLAAAAAAKSNASSKRKGSTSTSPGASGPDASTSSTSTPDGPGEVTK